MKKKLLLLTTLVAMLQFGTVTYAETAIPNETAIENTQISPRAEVKEWRFRDNKGQLQKRLWSVTYGRWIGEWIDVN